MMDNRLARHNEYAESSHTAAVAAAIYSQPQSTTRADTMGDVTTDHTSLDPDTCRICRGEGTPDEPLFYPCKCSGSIKYVHQDCLMEWLSHSQKKHCELCKTPFRFTKLYSPDMPKHLPFHIFIHHMTRYLFRNIVTWLRAALVTSVWLGWLPYLMRSVWAFLFWISDEGFGGTASLLDARNVSAIQGANTVSLSVTGTTTCPSTPLLAATTTAASLGGVIDKVPMSTLLKAMAKPLNISTTHSWLRMLLGLPAHNPGPNQDLLDNVNLTVLHKMSRTALSDPRRSLLSEVGFLQRITRNPAVNRIIIAVLEGQIITLLVIVCFILIILVRDYVVQQQPEINMRAAFAAVADAENDMAPPAAPINVPARDPDPVNVDEENGEDSDDSHDGHSATGAHDEPRGPLPTDLGPDIGRGPNLRQRPIAGMRRRPILNVPDQVQPHLGSSSDRSHIADRGLLNEVQPEALREPSPLREDREGTSARTTIGEYVRIYRAAEGNNDRIREIIRHEGLDETRFSRFLHINDHSSSPTSSVLADKADSDSSSWTWAGSDDGNDATDSTLLNKGKGRADDVDRQNTIQRALEGQDGTSSLPSTLPPSLLRPRAVSDGPQRHDTINLLANNSWSFSNLPSDAATQAQDTQGHGVVSECQSLPTNSSVALNLSGESAEQATITSNISIIPGSNGHSPNDFTSTSHNPEVTGPLGNLEEQIPSDASLIVETDRADSDATALPALDTDAHRVAAPAQQPNTIVGRVADFMWGDVPPGDADDVNHDEAVDIFGDNQNPPFMHDGPDGEDDEEDDQDEIQMAPDVVEAAVAAGLDPEAVEDAEDFDGIMELIGMRGPMAGLFQNAVFCAFLVSISIFLGIFVPYNIGRVAAWILANPARLFKMVFSFAKFVQDSALLAVGYTSTFVFNLLEVFRLLFGINGGKQMMRTLRSDARQVSTAAFDRIASGFMSEMPLLSTSEMRNFSAVSHQALLVLKANIRYSVSTVGTILLYIFGGNYLAKWTAAQDLLMSAGPVLLGFLSHIPSIVLHPSAWMINLSIHEAAPPLNAALAYWDAHDRTWAILLGYASLTLLAALYLGRGTPFSTGQTAQEWEASIIDALNQASGVMKVILIISIEMLIFPLYCGLLLDIALLPLFEHTTLKSRVIFTYNYPLTSIFVHWFIGTGYMFHFALFVSMCRKIMRKGVLYFIRDPDDPEFHPVRDVLERNVTTQLRKILFSAFVYGALVVICLGGVVWGLSFTMPNVLPIHYTSNEPVLEFPVDLLFCNFLMPLAVKFFKPSDGLHAMYTWWFRKCAKGLRLTWFLFGERRIDEEGKLLINDPHNHKWLWWRKTFLEVNSKNEVIPKRWDDFFDGGKAKPSSKISRDEMIVMNDRKRLLIESGQLIPDGRFVRSPASDQVKIPKGHTVFTDVSEQEIRQNRDPDRPETDLHSGNHYQVVYIPPWFRVRIFVFILSIWIFAAVTGVSSTIVPLVFGRRIFKALVPSHIRTNDIYAFSIGVYVLSSASYLVFHLHSALDQLRDWATSTINSMLDRHAFQRAIHMAQHTCKLAYTYTMLLLVFPILTTVLVEIYVLIPLHTYMYSMGTESALRLDGHRDGHTVRVIQAWTLGILYLKLGSRALTLYGGRPAQAVRAVLRRGWLEPDVGVLTRAFVIPGVIASTIMIFMPPVFAWVVLSWTFDDTTEVSYEMQVFAYRLAYPLTAVFWAGLFAIRRLFRILEGWQVRIRDEAYLMGERLHNFTGTAAKASVWRGSTRM
ncbi:hypothetical protein F5Y19DRAFT_174685 [Xylariaceae sp. FL1651]|nr:hypothetical protein F5Y19DRAFT_174685 [Xylariaceae sp. FL1651]